MNLTTLQAQKNIEKIVALTAYDALIAKIIDDSSVEIVLIGDSLGMVIKGDENTLGVTMSEMIYHTKIVAKQCQKSYVIADMPYQSYTNPKITLNNAKALIEAGAEMVKLEGCAKLSNQIKTLTDNNIPICGHLGLQPQSIQTLGGYKMQGKTKTQADKILSDAILLEKLGIDLLVIECVPNTLAKKISQTLKIPVIGIGAGFDCDGQILVSTDILGLGRPPKFAKNFLAQTNSITKAVELYAKAVKNQQFP